MKKLLTICATVVLAGTFSARADQTGLHIIHDLGKERGRLCMSGHVHEGNGSGATRRAARRAAVSSWASFTALEYGTDWAHFRNAGSRFMKCNRSGRGWACHTSGRPCLSRARTIHASRKGKRARPGYRVSGAR